jgi:hypothetical protein
MVVARRAAPGDGRAVSDRAYPPRRHLSSIGAPARRCAGRGVRRRPANDARLDEHKAWERSQRLAEARTSPAIRRTRSARFAAPSVADVGRPRRFRWRRRATARTRRGHAVRPWSASARSGAPRLPWWLIRCVQGTQCREQRFDAPQQRRRRFGNTMWNKPRPWLGIAELEPGHERAPQHGHSGLDHVAIAFHPNRHSLMLARLGPSFAPAAPRL